LAVFRRFRGALHTTRLALLALAALAVVGPTAAFAAKPHEPPSPRVMRPGEASGFRLPFELGTSSTVEQGWNTSFSHNGKAAFAYDFAVPLGTPIVAAADGIVSYVHGGERGCGGVELFMKANLLVIDHPDGSATQYAHLTTIGVKNGDTVRAGQVIGMSGDTGYSQCLPHLHFARQFQEGALTQSVPVYFQGYEGEQFHDGDVVTPQAAPCAAPNPKGKAGAHTAGKPAADTPLDSICGVYTGSAPDAPQSFERLDSALSFDWRATGPGSYWLDAAGVGFSARWSGRFRFSASGTYVFHIATTESVTVSIDGVRVAARAVGDRQVEVAPRYELAAGVHLVEVQYVSIAGHDRLQVDWHLAPAGRFDDL
jgi:murein DD-endopeptidase MepM/ murein hydrolase activator NlpD